MNFILHIQSCRRESPDVIITDEHTNPQTRALLYSKAGLSKAGHRVNIAVAKPKDLLIAVKYDADTTWINSLRCLNQSLSSIPSNPRGDNHNTALCPADEYGHSSVRN